LGKKQRRTPTSLTFQKKQTPNREKMAGATPQKTGARKTSSEISNPSRDLGDEKTLIKESRWVGKKTNELKSQPKIPCPWNILLSSPYTPMGSSFILVSPSVEAKGSAEGHTRGLLTTPPCLQKTRARWGKETRRLAWKKKKARTCAGVQ